MALKYALLASLNESSATGYQLTQRFKERMGNVWNASHQQVYRELGQLHDAGLVDVELVEQSGKPDRKVYQISESGREALAEWANGTSRRPPTRDPFLLKLFAGDLWQRDRLLVELAQHEQEWQTQLAKYQDMEKAYFANPEHLPRYYRLQYLALKRGIMALESWLAWAGEVRSVSQAE